MRVMSGVQKEAEGEKKTDLNEWMAWFERHSAADKVNILPSIGMIIVWGFFKQFFFSSLSSRLKLKCQVWRSSVVSHFENDEWSREEAAKRRSHPWFCRNVNQWEEIPWDHVLTFCRWWLLVTMMERKERTNVNIFSVKLPESIGNRNTPPAGQIFTAIVLNLLVLPSPCNSSVSLLGDTAPSFWEKC